MDILTVLEKKKRGFMALQPNTVRCLRRGTV